MQRQITQTQLENIQIDYGMIYIDFGLATERRLGPTKGGGEFKAVATIRGIEYDGQIGPTKGVQVVDDITASLTVASLDTSMDDIALAMPWASYAASKVTGAQANAGVIASSAYFTNLTMFAKCVGGAYKKIQLFNVMNEGEFGLNAAPKAEGTVGFTFTAHWDATDATDNLFTVESVETMGNDTTAPTVITVPADGGSGISTTANLTATFSEPINQADMIAGNFVLIKASDGTIVAGALTYTPATNLVTFDPTASLDAGTAYIWIISNVRDLAGNKMVTVAKNFTTA